MVSNHLRKSKDLNGGQKYTPESTGRGSRDPQISELNKLLKTYTEGTPEFNQIVEAINARKSKLAAERTEALKAKKQQKELSSIDMDALPEELKHLANDLVSKSVHPRRKGGVVCGSHPFVVIEASALLRRVPVLLSVRFVYYADGKGVDRHHADERSKLIVELAYREHA